MTTPVIIDIVVIIVLVGFTIYGARRGLLRALAGLLVVVVALVGAGIVAATFTQPVTKLVTPLIADHIEKKVDAIKRSPNFHNPKSMIGILSIKYNVPA